MLPGRQLADDWLDFMLSQKNLWPTFTTRGALTEVITEKTFRKERRRLQAKHLWMEVKLSWNVLSDRMYTSPLVGSHVSNFMRCYSTNLPGAAKRIPMKKKHTVDLHTRSPGMVEQCQEWMLYYKCQCAPLVQDIKGFLQAFRGKEEDARAEVEAYMEYCAKRWQTREGTYQLKRDDLLPDVRDPPEQEDAEVDMKDI